MLETELEKTIKSAIHTLPDECRTAFILSRYQNTPNKKIAEQLGISVKSVEFHITKALKILRTELKDYLVSILF